MNQAALTYTEYLKIDELLSLNHPQSDEHDEPLFIAIHQVYELWFKQVLHELTAAQSTLEAGNSFASLATLGAFAQSSRCASASSTFSRR